MKKMICILFCLLILLCSCQKTPEEPIVVGKNQETMIEKAEENENALVKEEIASRYQTEITKDKLTVSVDAEVKIAKTTMPILQVESVDFTQEQVDVMWEALVGETTMYPYAGETKSMIQEVIDEYRQKLEWQTDQDEIDRINMMIEKCEAAYQTAPESVDAYEGIPKLEVDQMDDFEGNIVSSEYTRLSAHEDPFKLKGKTFSVRNNYTKNGAPEYKDAVLSFQTSTNDYQYFESEIRDDEVIVIQAEDSVPAAAYNLTITPKEAKELAEKFTEETKEAGEFRVSVLKLVKNEIGQYAYLIECQRMMEGVPCAYIKGESTIGESEEY
ncbi:MAG: hypothetical protein IKK29_03110, partial [Christensenellaceae bacterium]|nr:hypothetical protein [Christensenellaceae bacterium]